MNAVISLMQFDVTVMDILWLLNVLFYLTYGYHRGLRGRMDLVLSGLLGFCSLGAAFVHGLILVIIMFVILLVATVWCLAYVAYDQFQIWSRIIK